MELDDGRASVSMVEMGANKAEQHLESIPAAVAAEETPFHLSKKNVEGTSESKVEGFWDIMAFWVHFRSGSSHPGTQVGVSRPPKHCSSHPTRMSLSPSLILRVSWCAASILSSAVLALFHGTVVSQWLTGRLFLLTSPLF